MPRGNPATLKSFPKGTSGNPGGRPRNAGGFAAECRDLFSTPIPDDVARSLRLPLRISGGQALAARLLRAALFDHSVSAARELVKAAGFSPEMVPELVPGKEPITVNDSLRTVKKSAPAAQPIANQPLPENLSETISES